MLGKQPSSERNNEERQDKPDPVELTIAERRIKERLEQHWHEPDPYGAPIDSTLPRPLTPLVDLNPTTQPSGAHPAPLP